MPNSPMPANGAAITCPGCGAQMSIMATPMEQEGLNQEELPVAQPEEEAMSEVAQEAPAPDEFDTRASEIEKTRGKAFKNKAGVAAALREMRG